MWEQQQQQRNYDFDHDAQGSHVAGPFVLKHGDGPRDACHHRVDVDDTQRTPVNLRRWFRAVQGLGEKGGLI